MALNFGWKANDVRESLWKGDPAFRAIPAQALRSYDEDGDASHIAPYQLNGRATKINFRNLTSDETQLVSGLFIDAANSYEAYMRAAFLCFRIALWFPDEQERIRTPDGAWHDVIVKERGIKMLAREYVDYIHTANPGMVAFYGKLILDASIPTDTEKKASSQQSTPTQSGEVESTAGSTVGSLTVAVA